MEWVEGDAFSRRRILRNRGAMAPFTLTEAELVADPEAVFKLLEKIGEG